MNINHDGAEIDCAENIELYGDWVKFNDREGSTIKIASDVVLKLAEFLESAASDFSDIDRNELLKELLPYINKLFGMEYKAYEQRSNDK